MNEISIIFIIYFYISIIIFLFGIIYIVVKWIFSRKGITGTYLGFPYLFTYPGQENIIDALKNILKRIFLFPTMKYEVNIEPSFVDNLAYLMNPSHNHNETFYIYRIRN